jgi:hypothetical protein
VGTERAFSPQVAQALQDITPRQDDIAGWPGVSTPLETGDLPLTWFVGYAPAEAPRWAIAVVVEESFDVAEAAIPIVKQTIQALE